MRTFTPHRALNFCEGMTSHGTHAQIVVHIKAVTYGTLDLSLP